MYFIEKIKIAIKARQGISNLVGKREDKYVLLIIASVVLISALAFITIFSYKFGWQWLYSIASSEMVLGQLLAQEKALISSNWFYFGELSIIHQTIFTMPLFLIFGGYENWALIRALNILLNNITLVLTYLFLMRCMKVKLKWSIVTALFLIVPLNSFYWETVTFGGFSILFLAQLFVCLGLFFKLINNEKAVNLRRLYFILFVFFSFALGVQGISSLQIVYVPLLLASIYTWHGKNKKSLFYGFIGFIACCAGYVVNNFLHYIYSFVSYNDIIIDNLQIYFSQKLNKIFLGIVDFFGFYTRAKLFSIHGIFSIIAIIAAVIILWFVYRTLRKARSENTPHFLSIFFAVSFVFNVFVFTVFDLDVTTSYFIPFMILFIPLMAIFFEHAEKTYKPIKANVIVCVVVAFIVGQGAINVINLTNRDINSERKGYIQYLLENDLKFGYASQSNANVTTELTNGKVEAAVISLNYDRIKNIHEFKIIEQIMPKKYLDPHYHKGESFILMTEREWDWINYDDIISKSPDYQDKKYVIIRYPSVEALSLEALNIQEN